MPPPGFEWDADKARTNLVKHRFAFEDAVRVWQDPRSLDVDDDRDDYGEARSNRIGMIFGHLFSVCYTDRNGNKRVISARRANRREHETYFAANA